MKAFHGYDECMDFGQLKILYGGMNGPHGVHVIIHGGDACQAIVEAFREAFPDHYPTRIDVCFDFQGDKAYDKLYGLALKTKRKFDIQCEKMGDWIDKKRGRSFKLGGKKSTYQAIIYEKATNKGRRTSTQTLRLTGYGSNFGFIPPRNPRSRRRSSNRNKSHVRDDGRTTSATSLGLPRSLGSSSTHGTRNPGASSPAKTCTASTSGSSPKQSKTILYLGRRISPP